uniref:Uncharacterized protein n=1 Tax=Rhizophora mucronata TaxID=61149 RepID=A0A2P2P854_RHIMU
MLVTLVRECLFCHTFPVICSIKSKATAFFGLIILEERRDHFGGKAMDYISPYLT